MGLWGGGGVKTNGRCGNGNTLFLLQEIELGFIGHLALSLVAQANNIQELKMADT
jgi:hypothetical protein